MTTATSKLRTATTRSTSDVANKLISMFLHELSGQISRAWGARVDSAQYGQMVTASFNDRCPYCGVDLLPTTAIVEHLDGMNRYRVGLHVPGNVLVSCKTCNSEKRRDDSCRTLTLADTGWASFLSHDGTRCPKLCATCRYWKGVWPEQDIRQEELRTNLQKIQTFRASFTQFEETMQPLRTMLPAALTQLYADCQMFARSEITTMLQRVTEPNASSPELTRKV